MPFIDETSLADVNLQQLEPVDAFELVLHENSL